MWKILIIYLSFEFISGNYHDPIYPVQNPCLAILDRLSETSSTFLNCAISRARPFKLCEGCVDHYARLHDLIDLLDSVRIEIESMLFENELCFFRHIQILQRKSPVNHFLRVLIPFKW